MARTVIRLTPTQIEKLSGPKWYAEGSVPGLNLYVSDKSARSWRLRYRLGGKPAVFVIGKAGEGGLTRAEACQLAQEARALVASGIHPLKAKAAGNAAQELPEASGDLPKIPRTFREAAEDWLGHHGSEWRDETVKKYRRVFERQVFPVFGDKALTEVDLSDLERMAERYGKTRAITHTAWRLVKPVFDRCLVKKWVSVNPVQAKDEVLKAPDTTRRAALEDPAQLGDFLVRLATYQCKGESDQAVIDVLRLLVIIPARVNELVSAQWKDFDLDKAQWKYAISKKSRKGKDPVLLTVPLPRQVVEILQGRKAQVGGSKWVFPSPLKHDQPIAPDRARTALIDKLGYDKGAVTVHGFRATHRSLCEEELGIDPVVLELNLGHTMPGIHGATYARAGLIPQRAEAMQKWADYIDRLREETKSQVA